PATLFTPGRLTGLVVRLRSVILMLPASRMLLSFQYSSVPPTSNMWIWSLFLKADQNACSKNKNLLERNLLPQDPGSLEVDNSNLILFIRSLATVCERLCYVDFEREGTNKCNGVFLLILLPKLDSLKRNYKYF